MARAKHRDKHERRQFESFVKKVDRQFKHSELLKQHKEFKKAQQEAIA